MTDPVNLILILAAAAILPFLAVVATSYIKISIVLLLVRNAIGAQQIPPNMAMNAVAIILSGFIMAPVATRTFDILASKPRDFQTVEGLRSAYVEGVDPLARFLKSHTGAKEKAFFLQSARGLWPRDMADAVNGDNMMIVLPAFTLSQMREAFEIGFLLYLPFVAIDLIVSNILLAMGMMMVSPLTISLPFKLFLFVMVDGWSRLTLGLVKTYLPG